MLITRQDYDKLVSSNPDFMQGPYLKLKRQWDTGGVTVSGDQAIMSQLQQLLGKHAEGSKIPTAESFPHSEFSSFSETGNGLDSNRPGVRRNRV